MSDLWEEGPEEYYGMLDIEDDDQATPPIDSKGVAELAELIGAFSHYNLAKAKRLKVLLAQEVKRADGCPCLLVEPCSSNCSCANSVMSGGCMRCCKYGSMEQRLNAAHNLIERLG